MQDGAEAAERVWITGESTTLEGSRLAALLVEVGAIGQLAHVLLQGGIRNRPEKNR
jgi:hypothetical protein